MVTARGNHLMEALPKGAQPEDHMEAHTPRILTCQSPFEDCCRRALHIQSH